MANTTADLIPFEALLESTNEGIYGIDAEGKGLEDIAKPLTAEDSTSSARSPRAATVPA